MRHKVFLMHALTMYPEKMYQIMHNDDIHMTFIATTEFLYNSFLTKFHERKCRSNWISRLGKKQHAFQYIQLF